MTLRWRSFSGRGREHDGMIYNLKGRQYLVYEWLQPFATEVTQNAQPKIVDSRLTLIFRMGQWPYGLLFCQERLPVCWLWIAQTTSPFNYPTYKTKICWHSVDAHFQHGAGSMMLLFMTGKAANTSFMNGCNHLPLRLPKMHSQKSSMLHWRSFSEWGSDHNVIYGVTARDIATDHAESTQAPGAGMFNYPAHKLNFHSLPATTQPWAEWSAEMQLTERMTFAKPNMHTVQVLNHLSALLVQHMVYHMQPCETDLEEHSQGVQHMRRCCCLLWKRRNQLLGFVWL